MIKHMETQDVEALKQEELNDGGSFRQGLTETSRRKSMPGGWPGDICQGIIMAYFLVITVIYPFYAPGGYVRIGEVKYVLFRNVSLVTLAVMAGMIVLSVAVRRDREWIIRNYRRMSVTDWFAYGYFIVVMLSYLCSAYKEDALWGVDGWYMGVITQMILIFLYFLFSRYFHCHIGWIGVWLLAAAGVFLLGICNRYSLYPISMEGRTEIFISTLGNINWFCGYWSVTAPIGITLYWCSDKIWIRILSALYSIIAMLSGLTQGSNSAYVVFMIMLLALFLASLGNRTKTYRFLELGMIFAVSCCLGSLLWSLPELQYNYMPDREDIISYITTALVTEDASLGLGMLVVVSGCSSVLQELEKYKIVQIGDYTKRHPRFKGIVTAAVVTTVCAAVIGLCTYIGALHVDVALQAMKSDDGYKQVFEDDWGNGRGGAWNCGINAYRSMDTLHKIVGVGPDCFADYVYDVPELAERLADQFVNQRLTNAHNEQLTVLVNVGALGWLCYAGIFVSAFVRYMRRADRQPLLYLCAVSILSYTAHNMVSFQQVLNAPFVFIVLGIGERLYRGTAEGISYES